MYSQKLRNINKSYYDHFSKNASWDMMEVVMTQEWQHPHLRMEDHLGEELTVGKSVGLDFFCFDRDPDGTFSYAGWGRGEAKYVNPKSLGDIILLPCK
jgi:hypothetical protein